jgi:hypothetical protein
MTKCLVECFFADKRRYSFPLWCELPHRFTTLLQTGETFDSPTVRAQLCRIQAPIGHSLINVRKMGGGGVVRGNHFSAALGAVQ